MISRSLRYICHLNGINLIYIDELKKDNLKKFLNHLIFNGFEKRM